MKLRSRRFHGHKFRRQHSIDRYIVDFVCTEKKLIIELDGDAHELKKNDDALRDETLRKRGFLILRFRNHELKNSMDWCMDKVHIALEREISLPPSP